VGDDDAAYCLSPAWIAALATEELQDPSFADHVFEQDVGPGVALACAMFDVAVVHDAEVHVTLVGRGAVDVAVRDRTLVRVLDQAPAGIAAPLSEGFERHAGIERPPEPGVKCPGPQPSGLPSGVSCRASLAAPCQLREAYPRLVLSLVLKRKVPVSEDVLTATFFGAFRLFSEPATLSAILALATRRDTVLVVPDFDKYDIELWPEHRSGEPDARIILRKGTAVVGRLLIEAKLGAEKSGMGAVSEDGTQGDQLARYLLAEAQDHPTPNVSLIYLTHHACCPRVELDASEAQFGHAGRDDLRGRLFWMSWRDVEACLHDLGDALPWSDLRAVFRHVSMYRFRGIPLDHLGSLDGRWAYPARRRQSRTYPGTTRLEPPSGAEWRYVRRAAQRSYSWPSAPRLHGEPKFYEGGSHG
jgi:hypothetical protein